jgi:hypothetical protein
MVAAASTGGDTIMSHRTLALATSLLAAALVLAGCGKKADQTAGGTAASDSLLSSNPVEQPQGQLQPQTGVQAGESTSAAPAPAPQASTPRPAATRSHRPSESRPAPRPHAESPSVTVPAGTDLSVTFGAALNSETAKPGDSWSGTLSNAVTIGSAAPFPAGSTVSGVVDAVQGAAKGDRAYLVLRVTSIEANGASHEISAQADSLLAGSTRKRNVGAVAGGAVAGALLGRALGGSGKGAVIGGILGGAAATGAVAASKGFQVEVPLGKTLAFKVLHDTVVKL